MLWNTFESVRDKLNLYENPHFEEGSGIMDREEIIAGLWAGASDEEVPNARTIDVHIRRLRSKLGDYEDIVRTVRGAGYRFDRHADVSIQYPSAPSPDVF